MGAIVFGIVLLLHGLVHLAWVLPAPADPAYPFVTSSSRLLPMLPENVLGVFAVVLVTLTVLGFTLAAMGLLGVPGLASAWRLPATIGAAASLMACALFWHPWFVVGPLIDAVVIAAVVTGWPKAG